MLNAQKKSQFWLFFLCISIFFCNFAADMCKRLLTYLFLTLTWMAQAAVYTPSSVPDPKANGQQCYVANPDAIIAETDVAFLNRCAGMLEQKTQVEMAIVAVGSIGDYSAFDFAYELYQRWGIGRKGKNTGVLVLFAEQSHDIRIMTGVGMEGVLPDAKCSRIIQEQMIPAFRQGDYGGGLCMGALRIYEICTEGDAPEELLSMQSVTNRGGYESADDEEDAGFWVVLVLVILLVIFLIWLSSKGGKGGHSGSRGGGGGPVIFTSGGRGFSSGGGFSGGSWGGGSTFGGGAGGKW